MKEVFIMAKHLKEINKETVQYYLKYLESKKDTATIDYSIVDSDGKFDLLKLMKWLEALGEKNAVKIYFLIIKVFSICNLQIILKFLDYVFKN